MSANGRLSDSELEYVEDNDRLNHATARAYLAAKAASIAEGSPIWIVEPAGAYRDYATQADMRANPERYNLNGASKLGLAAPGQSTHGTGDSFDIGGGVEWLIRNGHRWGIYRPFGAADPNHFRYNGTTAITASATVQPIPTRKPTPKRRKTMTFISKIGDGKKVFSPNGGTRYIVCGEIFTDITDDPSANPISTWFHPWLQRDDGTLFQPPLVENHTYKDLYRWATAATTPPATDLLARLKAAAGA